MEAITIVEGRSPETIGYAYMIINNLKGQVEQQNTKIVAKIALKEEDKTFANNIITKNSNGRCGRSGRFLLIILFRPCNYFGGCGYYWARKERNNREVAAKF